MLSPGQGSGRSRVPRRGERMAFSRWLGVWGALLIGAALATDQGMVGAPIEASSSDEGVRQALQFAMNEYNRASNDMYASRVSEIISVRKQIVAGIKYFITVKVGRTTCTKSATNLENCAFHEGPGLAKHATCHFEVYIVPWANSISLPKKNCQ